MDIIRFSIENPVKVAVGVILLVLFGLLSLTQIPIQLTPDVDKPIITVHTTWRGASPQEIETEIIERQEDKLKNVNGLMKMTSEATRGEGVVRLEFPVGTDKDIAYLDVSDKLRQVTDYPDEVDEPALSKTDDDMANIIAWMILSSREGVDVAGLKTFIEENVKPMLERAEGISEVNVYGGLDREMQVMVDPYRLAARGLTFVDLEEALRGQNKNISAGTTAQGKRDYSFRTVGEFRAVSDIEDTVVAHHPGGPVFVKDVATVVDGFKKQFAFVRSKGMFVIAMPARRETGANVLQAIDNLKSQIALVNETILAPRGLDLELTQVYDETIYINSAIDLVIDNIWSGGALAVLVLLLFLRSGSATAIIIVPIAVSVIGTFVIVLALGRSLNVILLAGMAFAVGTVIDNSIVVLENIYRHRSMGKTRRQAAMDGGSEVWGAILASSLTTMAVFLPVIFMEEEAGQLFRDIAIAIVSANGLSLVVTILVIPPLAARFFGGEKRMLEMEHRPFRPGVWLGSWVGSINRSTMARLGVAGGISLAALVLSYWMAPPAEYLPAGNKNLVIGFFMTPPGYSMDEFRRMATIVEEGDPTDPTDGTRPLWEAQGEAANKLPPVQIPVGRKRDDVREVHAPGIKNFFYVAFGSAAFMGCTSQDPEIVKPLEYAMQRAGRRVPGVFSLFQQASLFQSGRTIGNNIDLEIRGDDHDQVVQTAGILLGRIMQAGYDYPRPSPPNFDLGRPEVQIVPKRTQSAELGFDVRQVGFIVESCVDGAFVGEFNDHGERIDMVIRVAGTESASAQDIASIPVYTPAGGVVPLSSIADMVSEPAPQQINHIEEMNAITLSVKSKPGVALQDTMRELNEEMIAPLRQAGAIPPTVFTHLAGTADKLDQAGRDLLGDFSGTLSRPRLFGLSVPATTGLLAVVVIGAAAAAAGLLGLRRGMWIGTAGVGLLLAGVLVLNPDLGVGILRSRVLLALLITYLLMAALFESFLYPVVIMFTVPLATVGGFAALRLVHEISLREVASTPQQMDVVTILGFIILVGVVVNNAILLVHQALNYMRAEALDPHAAIAKSVETRTRPILMNAVTSIVGMVPLVVRPGAGSELYRGLGSVMIGGLLVSTVFTLVVIPALFSLAIDMKAWLVAAMSRQRGPVLSAAAEPAPISRSPEA